MPFEVTSKVRVKRDADGIIRQLSHPLQPFRGSESTAKAAAATATPVTARQLADQYVKEVMPALNLEPELADGLEAAVRMDAAVADQGPRLRFLEEKVDQDQATVSYAQTVLGLPIWQTGMSVRMRGAPYNVVSSQNSIQRDLNVQPPAANARYLPKNIDEGTLSKLIKIGDTDPQPTINGKRLLIYRYDRDDRGNAVADTAPTDPGNLHAGCPTLPISDVPESVENGRYYVVTEVLFTLERPGWEPINWGAFIEPGTGAVLRADVFIGCVDGQVLLRDPLTESGDTTITANSSQAALNGLRTSVTLEGLQNPNPRQELRGEFVRLTNVSSPNVAAPTKAPGRDFNFSVPTDNFAAVNAYYHCDRCFRLLEELGFDVRNFFNGTTFPVNVDHRVAYRGDPNAVNASAPGNAFRNGSDGFRFARLAPDATIGMAAEARVTFHEFGHAVLYGPLHSANFPFAHSIGDTLAALVFDPTSNAPDQGRTFPWTIIRRRHDHLPASGFAWGGTQDDTRPVGDIISHDRAGYKREQILSSTLFRFYRSLGGAHRDQTIREFASRYALYVIFDTIRSLSFVTPPRDAEAFADALMETDILIQQFEDYPGGTTHKIMRWAFERQGLYQPAGAPSPVAAPGAPPEVDVYLDDGRQGGYEPQDHYITNAPDVWCRNNSDDGLDHEDPVPGQTSHVYLRVRNRGAKAAANVGVRAFVSGEAGDRIWPDDWQELTPPRIELEGPLAPGGEEIVGPFAWTPAAAGDFSLLAEVDCPEDESIPSHTLRGPVNGVQLAQLDNNLAVRNVTVVGMVT